MGAEGRKSGTKRVGTAGAMGTAGDLHGKTVNFRGLPSRRQSLSLHCNQSQNTLHLQGQPAMNKNIPMIRKFIPLAFFLFLFVAGIALNEPQRVLEQALQICLDCMGIG
jgi:hypothetical protein